MRAMREVPPAPITIYFIQGATTRLIKIGVTTDLQMRLSALQATSPDRLTVLGCLPGSLDDEGSLHARFARERLHGEWFKPSARLMRFIGEKVPTPESGQARPLSYTAALTHEQRRKQKQQERRLWDHRQHEPPGHVAWDYHMRVLPYWRRQCIERVETWRALHPEAVGCPPDTCVHLLAVQIDQVWSMLDDGILPYAFVVPRVAVVSLDGLMACLQSGRTWTQVMEERELAEQAV